MTEWRTSSYSQARGDCAEVRTSATTAEVRDTKHRTQVTLSFPKAEWAAFLRTLKGNGL